MNENSIDDAVDFLVRGAHSEIAGPWSPISAEIWIRAEFRCEYCNVDLLHDSYSYKQGEIDHLLPKSLFPHITLSTNSLHYSLACRNCNKLKGRTVPSDKLLVSQHQDNPSQESRGAIIKWHSVEIARKREEFDSRVRRLKQCMRSLKIIPALALIFLPGPVAAAKNAWPPIDPANSEAERLYLEKGEAGFQYLASSGFYGNPKAWELLRNIARVNDAALEYLVKGMGRRQDFGIPVRDWVVTLGSRALPSLELQLAMANPQLRLRAAEAILAQDFPKRLNSELVVAMARTVTTRPEQNEAEMLELPIQAMNSLAKMGPIARPVVPLLCVFIRKYTGSFYRDLRFAAARAIVQIDPENLSAVPTLVDELVSDNLEEPNSTAVASIIEIASATWTDAQIQNFRSGVMNDGCLSSRPGPGCPEAVAPLAKLLVATGSFKPKKSYVVDFSSRIPNGDAFPSFEDLNFQAAKAIGLLGSGGSVAVPWLIAEAGRKNPFSPGALEGIGEAAHPAVPALEKWILSAGTDSNTKAYLIEVIQKIAPATASNTSKIALHCLKDPDAKVRGAAIQLAGKMSVIPPDIKLQLEKLRDYDESPDLRNQASNALH